MEEYIDEIILVTSKKNEEIFKELFKDKNIKSKAIDLVFVLLGLILLCWGSLV